MSKICNKNYWENGNILLKISPSAEGKGGFKTSAEPSAEPSAERSAIHDLLQKPNVLQKVEVSPSAEAERSVVP